MLYSEVIAKRILSLCKKRNISINQLAKMSGLNQSTIDSIIHGSSKNPRLMTIHKIAYSFGMTISELLNFPEMDEVTFESPDEDDFT